MYEGLTCYKIIINDKTKNEQILVYKISTKANLKQNYEI